MDESVSTSYLGPNPIVGKSAVMRPDNIHVSYSKEYALDDHDNSNQQENNDDSDEVQSVEDPSYTAAVAEVDDVIEDNLYQPEKPNIISFAGITSIQFIFSS